LFIMEYSTVLEDWQRDIMTIIREEMLYFWPQLETKIMNEGWASYREGAYMLLKFKDAIITMWESLIAKKVSKAPLYLEKHPTVKTSLNGEVFVWLHENLTSSSQPLLS
jgi:spore cortex formation protein SpoVR/YcgB (stage V sporulation)